MCWRDGGRNGVEMMDFLWREKGEGRSAFGNGKEGRVEAYLPCRRKEDQACDGHGERERREEGGGKEMGREGTKEARS